MTFDSSSFSSLTDYLTEIFNESAKRKIADWKGKMLFDTATPERQDYVYRGLDGVAQFGRVAEGGQFPAATLTQGDTETFTQKRYGGRVSITKDMRKFDLYNEMERLVRSNTDKAFDDIDQSMADLLLGGFGTSYTDIYDETQNSTSIDDVAFFSASHTNNQNSNNARNLIRDENGTANPGLDRAAIVTARKDAKVHTDANGLIRPVNLSRLVVTPTNEDLAERIVMSSGPAGTPNVDINPLKSSVNNIIVWERLETRGYDATDTSAYWFMYDPANVKDTLKAPMTQLPIMTPPTEVHDSLNWEYVIDAYYALGIGDPFAVWGSTGANG